MKLETLIQKLKVAQKTNPHANVDVVIQYCDYECEPTFVSTLTEQLFYTLKKYPLTKMHSMMII